MGDQCSSLNPRVSERTIRNALRLVALQHPITVLSLAIAAVSLIHLIGFSRWLWRCSFRRFVLLDIFRPQ